MKNKIYLGHGYWMTSDQYQLTLYQHVKCKKTSRTKNEYRDEFVGYYNINIGSALDRIFKRELHKSMTNSEDLKELIVAIKKIEAVVRDVGSNLSDYVHTYSV